MHSFIEIATRAVVFNLSYISDGMAQTFSELQESGATRHVKQSQMFSMARVVLAIGIFSASEAALQNILGQNNDKDATKNLLFELGHADLAERYELFYIAINVLKHGRGKSYDKIYSMSPILPFKVRGPHEEFFCEGDVSEVDTLIYVDDKFVTDCLDIIKSVHRIIALAQE